MTRLWGKWTTGFFQSGTTIVVLEKYQHKPNLYIYADVAVTESRQALDRMAMCHQLKDFMNGGVLPRWLLDFERISETQLKSITGANIYATGPSIDRNPPKLHWVLDRSPEAEADRARLIDVLWFAREHSDYEHAD